MASELGELGLLVSHDHLGLLVDHGKHGHPVHALHAHLLLDVSVQRASLSERLATVGALEWAGPVVQSQVVLNAAHLAELFVAVEALQLLLESPGLRVVDPVPLEALCLLNLTASCF